MVPIKLFHCAAWMCVLQVIHGWDQHGLDPTVKHGLTNQLVYLCSLVSVGIIDCFYLVYH